MNVDSRPAGSPGRGADLADKAARRGRIGPAAVRVEEPADVEGEGVGDVAGGEAGRGLPALPPPGIPQVEQLDSCLAEAPGDLVHGHGGLLPGLAGKALGRGAWGTGRELPSRGDPGPGPAVQHLHAGATRRFEEPEKAADPLGVIRLSVEDDRLRPGDPPGREERAHAAEGLAPLFLRAPGGGGTGKVARRIRLRGADVQRHGLAQGEGQLQPVRAHQDLGEDRLRGRGLRQGPLQGRLSGQRKSRAEKEGQEKGFQGKHFY